MSFDDYLEATGWKWYMISLHFLGWLRILSIDLKKYHGITHKDFYSKLFSWFLSNPQTLLYKEYHVTMRLLKKVFERKIPWGRKVSDVSDIYWEYEEATGLHIAKDKNRFYNEILDFLDDTYNNRYTELVEKQSNKMLDPFIAYDGDLEKYARECLWWGRRADRFFVKGKI